VGVSGAVPVTIDLPLQPIGEQSIGNSEEPLLSSTETEDEMTVDSEVVEDVGAPEKITKEDKEEKKPRERGVTVRKVPFYSQFSDISTPAWQKVGCGIASLAMLIDYYKPQVAVDDLLDQGIESGAYISDAGWSHAGLIGLSKKYGLSGESHSLADSSMDDAFATLEEELEEGPVMASVHYTFDPQNPIPHLVVVNGVKDGKVYYNDPAEKTGGGTITIAKFQGAWKKRYIDIRPIS
jgi:predicted double-glycine peptidase